MKKTGVFKEEIITDDDKLAEIFIKFFSGAVKSLDINYYEYFSWDCIFSENEDPIFKAIEKYSKHPSILKIKEHYPQNNIFSFSGLLVYKNNSRYVPIDLKPVLIKPSV